MYSLYYQKSLRESLKKPDFLVSDFAKWDRPSQLHIGFQALHQFVEDNGSLPRPHNETDAEELVQLAKNINDQCEEKVISFLKSQYKVSKFFINVNVIYIFHQIELNDKLLKQLAYGATGDLSPMVAVLGGLVAQEVLKACSGKFNPIQQYFYFDSLESLPDNVTLNEETCAPVCLFVIFSLYFLFK